MRHIGFLLTGLWYVGIATAAAALEVWWPLLVGFLSWVVLLWVGLVKRRGKEQAEPAKKET